VTGLNTHNKLFLSDNQILFQNTNSTIPTRLHIDTKYTITNMEIVIFDSTSSTFVVAETTYRIEENSQFPLTIQKNNINDDSISIYNATYGTLFIKSIILYFDVYLEVPINTINSYFDADIMNSIPTINTNLIEVWLDYEDPDKAVLLTIYDWDIFDVTKYETALDLHLPYNVSWGAWYIEEFNLFVYTIWSSENNIYMIIIM